MMVPGGVWGGYIGMLRGFMGLERDRWWDLCEILEEFARKDWIFLWWRCETQAADKGILNENQGF